MATEVRWRRGTTAENDNFTGAEGEITVDIDKKTIRVHDGATQGGGVVLTEGDEILGTAAYEDIGSDPDEIPTNSDLGTAAYEDIGDAEEHESPSGVEKLARLDYLGAAGYLDALLVDSVSDLRSGSFPASLKRIWLAGYYGVGTAGGGPLYRDDESTEDDNGGTVFVDADGSRWKRQKTDTISFEDFGAVRDAGDMHSNIQAALDDGPFEITGGGGSYRVDSTLSIPANTKLSDCHIDFSNADSGDTLFESSGEEESFLLTAYVNAGDTVVSVPDGTKFSVDDYVLIKSDKLWESKTNSSMSEMARVRSISGDNLTLYSPLLYAYMTADNAACVRLDFAAGISLKNVSATGGGAGLEQRGTLFSRCLDLTLEGCDFEDFDIASIRIERSARFVVRGTKSSRNASSGTGYGISIFNGSQWGTIEGCYFDDCRHGVTIGGVQGVNRYITVHGCHAYGCRDSGLDSHPAGDYIIFDGNHSEQVTGGDGLIMQGANSIISNNTVIGATRHGIFAQMEASTGSPSVSISGNIVSHPTGAGESAVYLLQQGSVTVSEAVIANNVIKSEWTHAIRVYAESSNINRITVTGNACNRPSEAGILFNSATEATIWYGSISANTIRGFAEQIYLNAAESPGIQYLSVSANGCQGGTYGIRAVNTNRIAYVGNVVSGADTPLSVDGNESVGSGNVT